jgi:putative flippase GtrA
MAASLIDIVLFSVFITAIGSLVEPNMKVFVATFAARAISSMFNCIFNKRAVFKSNAPFIKILLKYYSVCIVQTMVSYLAVSGFSTLLSIEGGPLMVLTKIIVDLILFFVSFKVQRAWVYKE